MSSSDTGRSPHNGSRLWSPASIHTSGPSSADTPIESLTAAFDLDGETYTLPKNNGPHSLHGGKVGFDSVRWTVVGNGWSKDGWLMTSKAKMMDPEGPALNLYKPRTGWFFRGAYVSLRHTAADGEQGYPGALTATVTYMLKGDTLTRRVRSDRPPSPPPSTSPSTPTST